MAVPSASILRRPVVSLVLAALVVVAAADRAFRITQDNSPETLFSADRAARQIYRRMVETFGGDEFLLIEFRGRGLNLASVRLLAEIEAALGRFAGVRRVWSLASRYRGRLGSISQQTVDDLRDEALVNPIYQTLGLYRPKIPALAVAAQVVLGGTAARKHLAGQLARLRRQLQARGLRVGIAGLAPANAAIDRQSRRALGRFMPLVVLISALIGGLLFRSLKLLLAILLPVGSGVLVGVAVLQMAGESLNLITGVMPPLVLAVGFAGGIHLVSEYVRRLTAGSSLEDAVREALGSKRTPTAFALGTTAIGFASLGLSDMRAIRMLGLCSGAALLATAMLLLTMLPALLILLRPVPRAVFRRHRVAQSLARRAVRWAWCLAVGSVILLAGASVGSTRLRTSIDGMELLPASAVERRDYQRLESEGLALGNVDLWIEMNLPQSELLEAARRLRRLARQLGSAPLVAATLGVHDLLALANYQLSGDIGLPADDVDVQALTEAQRLTLRRQLSPYYSPSGGLKLTLFSRAGAESAVRAQRELIQREAQRAFPQAKVHISGQFTLLTQTPGALMRTLRQSAGLTALSIALLFVATLRSLRLATVGMLVNLLPVWLVLGAMGWLQVPLDVASVMTASVAFGLAVDNTYHFLYQYRRQSQVVEVARLTGDGIISNSLVVAGGFVVLGASGFVPVTRFGLLTAISIVLALAADLLVLPALLSLRRSRKNGSGAGR